MIFAFDFIAWFLTWFWDLIGIQYSELENEGTEELEENEGGKDLEWRNEFCCSLTKFICLVHSPCIHT